MCLPHSRRRKNYPHIYDLDPYMDELIKIDLSDDVCSVCGGDFKHTQKYSMTQSTPTGLKEVVFKTAHNGCLKIIARIKQKRAEILDLEFQLFCKAN